MNVHIPEGLKDHEPELKRFFDAMVFKLNKNRHKGKWQSLDLSSVMTKLVEEVEELNTAISEGNVIEIALEAADVANFALMAADIAIRDAT